MRALHLEQFRVFEFLELAIPDAGMLVVGANGTGKSSIIDAILLISTTRSRRGVQDADLIRHGSGEDLGVAPYARARGEIDRDDLQARIEIYIERPQDRPNTRKLIRVGDTPRRAVDVVGILPTVGFAPDDLDLISGSPSNRRRFLDVLMSQIDNVYLRHLSRYQRMLSHRNGLLREGGPGRADRGQFQYWDEQVVALGSYLIARRLQAIQLLSASAARSFAELAPQAGELGIAYRAALDRPDEWWDSIAGALGETTESAEIVPAAQRIGQGYEQALDANFYDDLARGVTQIGPHRDDFNIQLNGRDISRFGSRGQQRMAVVALKLGEIELMSTLMGVRPVFLLDDVLSELDPGHRESLLQTVQMGGSQLIVTATEPSLVESTTLSDLAKVRLNAPGSYSVLDGDW